MTPSSSETWSAANRPLGAVVVTGVGMVSPLGPTAPLTWDRLVRGGSAIRRVSLPLPTGGRMEELAAPALLPDGSLPTPAALVAPGRLEATLLQAAREAWQSAGLPPKATRDDDPARYRWGCAVGNSKGDLAAGMRAVADSRAGAGLAADDWLAFQPGTLASRVTREFGLRGPSTSPVAACATGLASFAQAADWIARSLCDVVLAGSGDTSVHPLVLGSYRRLGVLAPVSTPEPHRAVRPFAADRRGFAIGEGAACFVVESADHAARRGATPLARVAGWHVANDALSFTTLPDSPATLTHTIRSALARAELSPGAVDHIDAHGTATPSNDPWEAAGLRAVFGGRHEGPLVSACKHAFGHALGAAGSLELAVMLLALRHQVAPPTLPLDHVADDCNLPLVGAVARCATIRASLKVSFGFGGTIAAVVLRQPDG